MKGKKRIDNIPFVVDTLLTLLGISATSGYVNKVLTMHPDYPGILAISESLREWGVKTEAAQGTIADLPGIEFPAIAHLKNNKYVVLEAVNEKQVTIISPTKGEVNLPIDQFNDLWSGVVLQVVQSNGAKEKNYRRHRKEQFLQKLRQRSIIPAFFILLAATFAGGVYGKSLPPALIPLGFLKIAGLVACAFMFAGNTGKNNILSRICKFKEKLDCQRVLESPGGRIPGISMVDMGLVYFSGGLLALLFSLFAAQTEHCLLILGFLNILTLPYTIFSLFYQAFAVRTWCLLCILVQAVFWCEFYFLYPFLNSTPGWPNFTAILPTVFGFGLILLSWFTLRPILSKYPALKLSETKAIRVQNQPDFINVRLGEVEGVDMGSFPFEVTVGPPRAPVTLTLVLNPLCRHCGETLKELVELVEIGEGKIKGIVRFLVGEKVGTAADAENSLDFDVACLVTGLTADGRDKDALAALDRWFKSKNSGTARFFKLWKRHIENPNQDAMERARDLLKTQLKWALDNDLSSTPVQYLHNLKLPDGISFKNLKYYLIRKLHY
ncbi:MAG: hypothetical protein GY765_28540 [bacterium]|nr:hypothetical protein [bacterium]